MNSLVYFILDNECKNIQEIKFDSRLQLGLLSVWGYGKKNNNARLSWATKRFIELQSDMWV